MFFHAKIISKPHHAKLTLKPFEFFFNYTQIMLESSTFFENHTKNRSQSVSGPQGPRAARLQGSRAVGSSLHKFAASGHTWSCCFKSHMDSLLWVTHGFAPVCGNMNSLHWFAHELAASDHTWSRCFESHMSSLLRITHGFVPLWGNMNLLL